MKRLLSPLLCLALLALCQAARADITILKGPYLQNVSSDAVVVMWQTSAPCDSTVDFGLTEAYAYSSHDGTLMQLHEVRLASLVPDTVYHYRIRSVSDGQAAQSADSTFRTAPARSSPFRFVVYGDSRSQPDVHAAVVKAIVASDPRFVIHVGDYTGDGTDDSRWQTEFFDPAAALLASTPLFPALGTHEANSPLYYQYFDPPDGGGGHGEQWYAFDYGDARFIVLDTDATYVPGSPQYDWLTAELQSASSEWLFAVHHHPAYSSGAHGGEAEVQAHLVPLYETYGVDAVFTGHDHTYERSSKDGICYVVTGGGGAPIGAVDLTPNPYQQYAESVYHHCTVDIDGLSATIQAVGNDGAVIDSVALTHPGRPPVADFSGTPLRGKIPLTVGLIDESLNAPSEWSWDFGDGEVSTEQSPQHDYFAPGRHAVSLTASNAFGSDTETKERFLWVSFRDVPITPQDAADHWALNEIMDCVDAGIVQGYPDGMYRPNAAVRRDQMAVFVSRGLAGGDALVPSGPAEPSFADVPVDHWAYDHIEYAVSRQIVAGYGDGTYQPAWPVTRAQMAVFISRSLVDPTGEEGLDGYEPPAAPTFPDVPSGYWSYKHVEYLAEAAVVRGYSDGLYRPTTIVTRDQMSVYVARAFDLSP